MEIKDELYKEQEELRKHREIKIAKEKIEIEFDKLKQEINLLKSLDLKQNRNLGLLREERDTKQRKTIMLESVCDIRD